jgi:PAS domain S-box-containing protein
MPTMKQTLSYLLLGQKGGKNKIQIIELLNDRPYNLNQLAEVLDVNYRTAKHHVDILVKNELVGSSKAGGYGEVYFLTPELESNIELFGEIVKKFSDFTTAPGFFQNLLEQTSDSVIIVDNNHEVIFWNKAAEIKFGFTDEEVLGNPMELFTDKGLLKDQIYKINNGEHLESFETQCVDKAGTKIDVDITLDCIKGEDNNNVGFVIMTRDITQRKHMEEKLVESREKYRSTLEGCCPETLEEEDKPQNEPVPEPEPEPEPQGPSCPVNYSDKKDDGKKKNCCG